MKHTVKRSISLSLSALVIINAMILPNFAASDAATTVKQVEVNQVTVKSTRSISSTYVELTLSEGSKVPLIGQIKVSSTDDKNLEVKKLVKVNDSVYLIEIAPTAEGSVYKLTAGSFTGEIRGFEKGTLGATLYQKETKALDNETVIVGFDKAMDPTTVFTPNVFNIKGLKINKVEYEKTDKGLIDYTKVRLTTDKQLEGTLYTLELAGLKDLDGLDLNKDSLTKFSFGGVKVDKEGPVLVSAKENYGNTLKVIFRDASELDLKTVLKLENYKFYDTNYKPVNLVTDVNLERTQMPTEWVVTLKLSGLKAGEIYTLEVGGLSDKFGNIISSKADYRWTFNSNGPDVKAPEILSAEAVNSTLVKLTFKEPVESESAEKAENYLIQELDVKLAKQDSENPNVVWLTTSTQTGWKVYRINTQGVKDLVGNSSLKVDSTTYFPGSGNEGSRARVQSAEVVYEYGEYYVLVKFNKSMKKEDLIKPKNYNFGYELGYGRFVEYIDDKTVKVMTRKTETGKKYWLTITNLYDINNVKFDENNNVISFTGI